MSGIKGPGGPTSPLGPTGASGPEGTTESSDTSFADQVSKATAEPAAAAPPSGMDALAAEISAGRMTPAQAMEVLIDQTAGPDMPAAQRAELRELLSDLLANDPHLAALAAQVG